LAFFNDFFGINSFCFEFSDLRSARVGQIWEIS